MLGISTALPWLLVLQLWGIQEVYGALMEPTTFLDIKRGLPQVHSEHYFSYLKT